MKRIEIWHSSVTWGCLGRLWVSCLWMTRPALSSKAVLCLLSSHCSLKLSIRMIEAIDRDNRWISTILASLSGALPAIADSEPGGVRSETRGRSFRGFLGFETSGALIGCLSSVRRCGGAPFQTDHPRESDKKVCTARLRATSERRDRCGET